MVGQTVLILEDDLDLAAAHKQVITVLTDWKVVVAHSLAAMQEMKPEVLSCELAILDINLGAGEPTGIDAYEWLREKGFQGRIHFMTGHARSHPLVVQAVGMGAATVLTKPVGVRQFLELIRGRRASDAHP